MKKVLFSWTSTKLSYLCAFVPSIVKKVRGFFFISRSPRHLTVLFVLAYRRAVTIDRGYCTEAVLNPYDDAHLKLQEPPSPLKPVRALSPPRLVPTAYSLLRNLNFNI
jgi:hypothetical protein